MKKLKAVIFDLDGTLLDTLDGITYYINSVFSDEGLPQIASSVTREIIGDGAQMLISRACARVGVEEPRRVKRILDEYKKRYDGDPFYLVKPYDGINEVINTLKSCGYKLAVLSNKPQFATVSMTEHFFENKFDAIRGGAEGIPLKPDPCAAKMILAKLGVSPDECAFVGDGETDILTAESLGAELSLSVLWGFRTREQLSRAGAKTLVTRPDELLDFLK